MKSEICPINGLLAGMLEIGIALTKMFGAKKASIG
jgi:hypothetical protein